MNDITLFLYNFLFNQCLLQSADVGFVSQLISFKNVFRNVPETETPYINDFFMTNIR